jgi:hypothetical protein
MRLVEVQGRQEERSSHRGSSSCLARVSSRPMLRQGLQIKVEFATLIDPVGELAKEGQSRSTKRRSMSPVATSPLRHVSARAPWSRPVIEMDYIARAHHCRNADWRQSGRPRSAVADRLHRAGKCVAKNPPSDPLNESLSDALPGKQTPVCICTMPTDHIRSAGLARMVLPSCPYGRESKVGRDSCHAVIVPQFPGIGRGPRHSPGRPTGVVARHRLNKG